MAAVIKISVSRRRSSARYCRFEEAVELPGQLLAHLRHRPARGRLVSHLQNDAGGEDGVGLINPLPA
jgi:hypothetical protein